MPTFGVEPETRLYVGAVALMTYQFKDQRLSNAQVEFTYTLNKQSIGEIEYDLFPSTHLAMKGKWSFKDFPDLYWNLASPWEDGEGFTSLSFGGFSNFLYIPSNAPYFMIGPYLSYESIDIKTFEDGGVLDNDVAQTRLTYWGVGLNTVVDSRDAVLNPSKGVYADLLLNRFSNDQTSLEMEMRYFKRILNNVIVASKVVAKKASFQHPFQMFKMGNSRHLRGYYNGNFRISQVLLGQLELRVPIIGRFGVAGFGALGSLNHEDITHVLPSYGGGLRFKIDRESNINLRFDYALGKNNSGFYVGFGEAF